MNSPPSFSRRRFLRESVLTGTALATWGWMERTGHAAALPKWPVAIFSKVYQELNLGFDETAEVTAEVGLDGIDCPVRPGGQILPERAADDLPRIAAALSARQLKVLLLTTAITRADSPHAEDILRAARKLGVKYYRLGYWRYEENRNPADQLDEIKAQLKDLAALNKELGTCAILQNHAGTGRVGAKVADLYEIARAFDPDQVAIAFDIGHAIHELDNDWRAAFMKLQSHFRVAYVKDWKRGAGFVPFGEGEIGPSGFLKLLGQVGYNAPISMHTEYEWARGEKRTRPLLVQALKRDLGVLKNWLGEA